MVLGDVVSLIVWTRFPIYIVSENDRSEERRVVQTTRLTTSPNTMHPQYIKNSARRTYMPNRTHNTSYPTSLVRGCVNPGIPITVKQPLNRSYLD